MLALPLYRSYSPRPTRPGAPKALMGAAFPASAPRSRDNCSSGARGWPVLRGAVIVAHRPLLRQPRPEDGDAGHRVPFVQAHHDDTAGGAAVAVDGLHVGAHDLAPGADEEQLLIVLGDELDGRHGTRLAALE